MSSSSVAYRDGTMSPSASLCVRAHDDEKPRPPAARLSSSSCSIAARSSGVAAPCVARSPMTTRRIVEWPTRKPAFGASVPSIRSRYSPKVFQSHGTPAASADDRHALDPGEHAHQVVAVLGAERRDREAAVAADHRRDAVQRRRAQRRVPEHLRVVVRVDVDEAGRDDLAVGVDRARRGLVDVADRDDASVADADVAAAAPGAPVPSTIEPPRMSTSSIASPSELCRTQLLSTRCAARTRGPSCPRHRCQPRHRCRGRAPLRREGARVAIVARSLEPGSGGHLAGSLRETADAIEATGGTALPIVADLSDPACDRAGDRRPRPNASSGPVDILVNNAAACFYLSHRRDLGAPAAGRVRGQRDHAVPAHEGRRARHARTRSRAGSSTSRARSSTRARTPAAGAVVDVRAEQGRARPADAARSRPSSRGTGIAVNAVAPRARGGDRRRDRDDGPARRVGANRWTRWSTRSLALATCDPARRERPRRAQRRCTWPEGHMRSGNA